MQDQHRLDLKYIVVQLVNYHYLLHQLHHHQNHLYVHLVEFVVLLEHQNHLCSQNRQVSLMVIHLVLKELGDLQLVYLFQ